MGVADDIPSFSISQPLVSVESKNVDVFEVPGRHAVGNG